MSTSRLNPNSICPCGTNKKYKKCCELKGIDYRLDDDTNELSRNVTLSNDVMIMLNEQHNRFTQTFGREPGPNDQLFFDAAPRGHFEREVIEFLEAIGADPAHIYAFEKIGFIMSDLNQSQISEEDQKLWTNAIAEYNKANDRPVAV